MVSRGLRSLPIDHLIAAPLVASAKAQGQLAMITADFIEEVGFDENGKVEYVEFSYEMVNADGDSTNTEVSLSVPLIAIVNVPSLSVKEVTIDFEMEIKTSTSSERSSEVNLSAKVSAGWLTGRASFEGSVGTSKQTKRSTNQTATYTINVNARDDPPEGLSKVLDILAASVEAAGSPTEAEDSSGD